MIFMKAFKNVSIFPKYDENTIYIFERFKAKIGVGGLIHEGWGAYFHSLDPK